MTRGIGCGESGRAVTPRRRASISRGWPGGELQRAAADRSETPQIESTVDARELLALRNPRKEPRMLVLSRQRDETIMIGDDVEITIVDIRGDKVRLGITAPTRIPVHRKEVYDAIKRENAAAAEVRPEDISLAADGARRKRAVGHVEDD